MQAKTRPSYVLLDRDGVINEDSDAFIKSPDEWQPIAGSLDAIALLYQQGFHIVVLTNQSGLARGLFDMPMLSKIHGKMRDAVVDAGGFIEAIYFCPHGPESDCECRKPKPGLLYQLARDKPLDLAHAVLIGDSLRDIQAAQTAGVEAFLVKTGKGQQTLNAHPDISIPVFDSLYDAAHFIISRQSV